MLKTAFAPFLLCFLTLHMFAQSQEPEWVKDAGTKTLPTGTKIYNANKYGAVIDSLTLSTKSIQAAIDACSAKGGGMVTLLPGNHLTGALFLKKA